MLRHTVLFRLADPSSRDDVAKQLRELDGNVPQIRSLSVDTNALDGPGTYHVALVATVDDAASFGAYAQHDVHLRVWQSIQPLVADLATIQVELDA